MTALSHAAQVASALADRALVQACSAPHQRARISAHSPIPSRKVPLQPALLSYWPSAYQLSSCKSSTDKTQLGRRTRVVHAAVQTEAAPLDKTWSNPSGSVLTEVVPGQVWAAERPFIWTGIDVGGKMGVVRLRDGSVWVHSPVPLDDQLKAAMDQLGPVKHIVTPNYEHAGFAQQWIDAYPDAKAYACPGLRAKKPEIKYTAEIGADGRATPAEWGGEFSFAFFDCEHNPFTLKPFFNEVVYVHHPSGVLFVTDLYWNYPGKAVPPGTFLWKQGMDKVYLPFYKSFMLKRKDKFEERLRTVLSWGFSIILPCHGDVVDEKAADVLRRHFQ